MGDPAGGGPQWLPPPSMNADVGRRIGPGILVGSILPAITLLPNTVGIGAPLSDWTFSSLTFIAYEYVVGLVKMFPMTWIVLKINGRWNRHARHAIPQKSVKPHFKQV
jgi:hypothetical protein